MMAKYANIIINRKIAAVDKVFSYAIPEQWRERIVPGMIVRVPFNRELIEAVVVATADEPPTHIELKEIESPVHDQPLFSDQLLQLSRWVADYYCCSWVTAMQAMLPAGLMLSGSMPQAAISEYYYWQQDLQQKLTPLQQRLADYLILHKEAERSLLLAAGFKPKFLRSMVKKGYIVAQKRRISAFDDNYAAQKTVLSQPQQQAIMEIGEFWREHDQPVLLYGVAGGGKTEIYLRLIEQIMAQGRQAIVLVPEIALSAQMVEMLQLRLNGPVAVLHSGLTGTARRRVWQEIAEGHIDVVVGARSAVFAPLPRLGLIIIDEEHENSYKQDNLPRFHARETAAMRCRLAGAKLLLGSATPSIVSFYKANIGEYLLVRLNERYYSAPPPQITVVDMREQLRAGNRSIFSHQLLAAVDQALKRGEQAALFINRRGYYTFYSCRSCGEAIYCPHCHIAMAYHKDKNLLCCHYCGMTKKLPEVCPHCGSQAIRHFGVGTQRVCDEIAKLFPSARVARLDSDVMNKKGAHQRIVSGMRAGQLDILVGTQMIAKGLDFPKLTVAAVVAADTLLNLPDWLAAERTFQLLSQLAGRAGRRRRQGEVIIQTYMPQALTLQAVAADDYQGFYEAELEQRQNHDYPPFKYLLRLLFSCGNLSPLITVSAAWGNHLQRIIGDRGIVYGPAAAPLAKIKDRWRYHIILKSDDLQLLKDAVAEAEALVANSGLPGKDIIIGIDVEPMNMM